MDNKTIISNLKSLKQIKPRSEWINQNREFLLSHISATKKQQTTGPENIINGLRILFQPSRLSLIVRPIVTVMVVLAVTLGGFATVSAAKNSLPGDLFYNFKRIGERTQLTLTLSQEKKAHLEIEFAERRSEELNFLIHSRGENEQKQQYVQQTMQHLKDNIGAANKRVASLKEEQPVKAVEVAKAIDQKTNELENYLTQASKSLDADNQEENQGLQKSINEAIEAVEKTGEEVVEVIVEKHLNGEVTQPDAEIKDILTEEINNTQKKIFEVQDKIAIVNHKLAQDVQRKSAAGKAEIPANLAPSQAELEKAEKLISDLAEKIVGAVATGENASDILKEADTLLKQQDYQEVIDKIKESKHKANEAVSAIQEIEDWVKQVEQAEEDMEEQIDSGEIQEEANPNQPEQPVSIEPEKSVSAEEKETTIKE